MLNFEVKVLDNFLNEKDFLELSNYAKNLASSEKFDIFHNEIDKNNKVIKSSINEEFLIRINNNYLPIASNILKNLNEKKMSLLSYSDFTIDYNWIVKQWNWFLGLGVIGYESDLIYSDLYYGSFKYKTVIPCNLYGKYDNFSYDSSHMIPGVIRRIHDAKNNNSEFVDIWGDGLARREFMYAEDLADFIYYAIENFNRMPQNINVGLGHDYSILDYYKIIASVIDFKGEFNHDLTKPSGVKRKLIDIKKLNKFGWSYKTKLETGIKETYDYFLSEIK